MCELKNILKNDLVVSLEEGKKLLGNDKAVYRLVDKSDLQKVYPDGLGYFSLPETEEGVAHFAIVKKYYPQCVISGKTALSLYDLSLDYIGKIDVDIPRGKGLKNELLNVHRVVESKIKGVVQRAFEDRGIPFEITIYSPERSLHEAYKYYRLSDSFYRVLKRYRSKYLNRKKPATQYLEILNFNKRVGTMIVNLLKMEDVDE